MPRRTVPRTDLEYFLVSLDEQGEERREPDGSLLSDQVVRELRDTSRPVTDVFLCSHGWKGDLPAAVEQYDRWLAAMLSCDADRAAVRTRRPDFRALVVGLHWPSLPWGEERLPGPGGVLSDGGAAPRDEPVDSWAARIADSDAARQALSTVLSDAAHPHPGLVLSDEVRSAYRVLYEESGLRSDGDPAGPPGADQEGFDPQRIVEEAEAALEDTGTSAPARAGGPGVLGGGPADRLKDLLLMPVRQLSFWKMKDRGRRIGEGGAHDLLLALQRAAPGARFHLMGHSFGCIVVSGAVAGRAGARTRGRPADSLFLVQGALSLWSYAAAVPFGGAGYYARALGGGAVSGPIATTTSHHDTAVRVLYPLGAKVKKQYLLDREDLPRYGGVGCFGLQGLGARATDLAMASVQHQYRFSAGTVHNLEADRYVRGGGGLSGAHSAIAVPEVAHVQWQLVLGTR